MESPQPFQTQQDEALRLEDFLSVDFMKLFSFPIHPRQASKMLAPLGEPFASLRVSA